MAEQDELAHAELMAIYQQAVEDIERAKQWGWQLAYQGVVANFGLLGVRQLIDDHSVLISAVVAGIMIAISWAISDRVAQSNHSLQTFRERLGRCYESLLPKSRELLGPPREKHEWPLGRVVWASCVMAVLLVFFTG